MVQTITRALNRLCIVEWHAHNIGIAVQDVITPANFCEDRLRGFGVARRQILAFSIDLLRCL